MKYFDWSRNINSSSWKKCLRRTWEDHVKPDPNASTPHTELGPDTPAIRAAKQLAPAAEIDEIREKIAYLKPSISMHGFTAEENAEWERIQAIGPRPSWEK